MGNISFKDEKNFLKETYNYKSMYKKILNLSSDFTFGLELEFANLNILDLKYDLEKNSLSNWNVYKDISVTKNNIGGELTSPVLYDKEYSYEDIIIACSLLNEKNAKENEFTSTQINIGAHILDNNINNWIKLFKMWLAFEDVIYRFSALGDNNIRTSASIYAVSYSSYIKEIRKLLASISNKDLLKFLVSDRENFGMYYRYSSLYHQVYPTKEDVYYICNKALENWTNVVDKSTVENNKYYEGNRLEFRTLNATIDPIKIQIAIQFFAKIIYYVTSTNYNEDSINKIISNINENDYNNYSFNKAVTLVNMIYEDESDKIDFLTLCLKKNKI